MFIYANLDKIGGNYKKNAAALVYGIKTALRHEERKSWRGSMKAISFCIK
jgi:hypothetical protein